MSTFKRHIFVCINQRSPDDPRGSCSKLGSEALHARFKAEAKKISVDFAQADVSILGISNYVQDVLVRLIDNAIKFGVYEGHVKVRIAELDSAAVITIEDNGIGIEPEEIESLYDPRARVGREAMHEGHVGLGLAISRGLVRAHRGDIKVSSSATEGTTFTVILPAA